MFCGLSPFLKDRGAVNAHFDFVYKLFLHRAGQEQRAPGTPRISGQSEHEGGKVVSPRYQPSAPRRHPSYSFLLESESIPGS